MTARIVLVPGRFFQIGLAVIVLVSSVAAGWSATSDIWWLLAITWWAGLISAALWGHGACARMLADTYPELVEKPGSADG